MSRLSCLLAACVVLVVVGLAQPVLGGSANLFSTAQCSSEESSPTGFASGGCFTFDDGARSALVTCVSATSGSSWSALAYNGNACAAGGQPSILQAAGTGNGCTAATPAGTWVTIDCGSAATVTINALLLAVLAISSYSLAGWQ